VRVLFNTYPVAFGCPGGGEIQLLKCKQALEALGIEVTLFDPWRPCFERFDVVHYFSVQGGSMNFCDYVKRIGLPLVISPVLWLTAENRRHFPLAEIRDLLHLCDRILPNSLAERDQLAGEFGLPREKFSVVPNGVDPDFALPADPRAFRDRFELCNPFLLNVANIEPRKNQRLLAQVARHSSRDLVLVGQVRDAAYFRECLDAGGARVRHVGHLAHHDPLLKSAYRACEVFVLPSLLETPGLAALEAAAEGAKIVVTEIGATREYFGSLVEYVDPACAESLARAIELAWSRPKSDELSARVLGSFTWTHAAKSLIDAYQRTLRTAGWMC
jgi:glycosyltransferase involved in cell wall biosynthesis